MTSYNRYRIRRALVNKGKNAVFSIGLPHEIAKPLYEFREDREYTAELTDDGILLRPADTQASPRLPAWARDSS